VRGKWHRRTNLSEQAAPRIRDFFQANFGNKERVHAALHGGDDYELLFLRCEAQRAKIPKRISGIQLTEIGENYRRIRNHVDQLFRRKRYPCARRAGTPSEDNFGYESGCKRAERVICNARGQTLVQVSCWPFELYVFGSAGQLFRGDAPRRVANEGASGPPPSIPSLRTKSLD